MAAETVALKDNVFLTLDDIKDWLRIPLTNIEHDNRLRRLLNMVTDMAERHIQGPIKTREFTETRDGDASNTIVPDYFPVKSIEEIRIDYNRSFSDATIIQPDQYVLRKLESIQSVGVQGTDIVVRDDGNTAIVGRIFIGSVVGAIQIKYTAGWGETVEEIPYDLQQAILLGVEYFYILRENRELNIRSKTNNQQGYSRSQGLPREVTDLLDPYVDHTLGRNNLPQKNTFTV